MTKPATAKRLNDLLSRSAERTPDAPAVSTAEGGDSLTYRDLLGGARDLAERLARHGVGPGDRVAVHAPKSLDAATYPAYASKKSS